MADVHPLPETSERIPLKDLVRDMAADIGKLIQSEIRLARAELSQKAKSAGNAAQSLGIAAGAGLFAAACFVTACVAALAIVMAVWLAALLMAILLGSIAAAAYVRGRNRLRRIDPVPQRTLQTLEADVEWAKDRTR